jgi:hypothetical protein
VTARIEGKLPTHPITETPRRQRDDGIKFKKKKNVMMAPTQAVAVKFLTGRQIRNAQESE